MNLKPMDENTLKFLKNLADRFDGITVGNDYTGARRSMMLDVFLAATFFLAEERATNLQDVFAFIGAIKNADTSQ